MLIVPSSFNTYRIMSIDPGLNNCGVASYEMEYGTNRVLSIDAFTLVIDKVRDISGLDDETFSERVIKLYKLKEALKQVFQIYNPSQVVCESPFFNRFRPTAYSALVEVLNVIRSSVIEYNMNIHFSTIEPLLIKKIVGAGMMKGKLDVKDAVSKNEFIMARLIKHLDTLDEHAIDAIAIGFSFLNISGVYNVSSPISQHI